MLSDAFKPTPVVDEEGNVVEGLIEIQSQKVNKVCTKNERDENATNKVDIYMCVCVCVCVRACKQTFKYTYSSLSSHLPPPFLSILSHRTLEHPSTSAAETSLVAAATTSTAAPKR